MSTLKPDTREKLLSISTATLATCLFKRGLRNQFIQGVQRLSKSTKNMVGEAYTLRYIPAREDLNTMEVFKDRSHPQRKGINECPEGAVFVIDSRKDARAASAGGILVGRLMARGVAGVVTDGGGRVLIQAELDAIAVDLEQLYDALDQRELSAGSPQARRLFS